MGLIFEIKIPVRIETKKKSYKKGGGVERIFPALAGSTAKGDGNNPGLPLNAGGKGEGGGKGSSGKNWINYDSERDKKIVVVVKTKGASKGRGKGGKKTSFTSTLWDS